MNTRNILITAALGAALVACSQIPKEAYFSRGEPDSLIDKSSEVVNLRIQSPSSVDEITSWINRDQPTRADVRCPEGDALCGKVQSALHQFAVPVTYTSSPDNSVALVYERVQARDCENRYIDNTVNPYNLNYPTFGCSTAVNIVQMVSDKRVFTNPPLMDYADANKAAQVMGFYNTPSNFTPSKVDSTFEAIATQENISSSDAGGGGGGR